MFPFRPVLDVDKCEVNSDNSNYALNRGIARWTYLHDNILPKGKLKQDDELKDITPFTKLKKERKDFDIKLTKQDKALAFGLKLDKNGVPNP